MASDRSADLVARVVAWHNRNPLARRITPGQVLSIGLVSFPFRVPARSVPVLREAQAAAEDAEAGTLRERAQARARAAASAPMALPPPARAVKRGAAHGRRAWRSAFSENLLAPIARARLVRWVTRHGSDARPGPEDAPVRELPADAGPARGDELVRLWSFTAAVETGALRVRLLVSPQAPHRVLGQRLIDRSRVAALGLALVLLAAVAWWQRPQISPEVPMLAGAGAAAVARPAAMSDRPPAASAPSTAPQAAPQVAPQVAPAPAAMPEPAPSAPASALTPAPTSAPQPASRPAAPATASSPAPSPATKPAAPVRPAPSPPAADESPARLAVVRLPPLLDEATRAAAREAGEIARTEARARRGQPPRAAASAPAAAPATAPATAPAPAPAPPQAAPAAPAAAAPTAWAVTTRSLRTRFESEQMLLALRDAAQRSGQAEGLRLEVLPAGADWRAVGWPFASAEQAERVRAALAARGLATQVVRF